MDAVAQSFYQQHPIVLEGNVSIVHISARKGKGVITNTDLQQGDILFTEFPVLSLQHNTSKRYFRTCEFCLKSIGTVREQWQRMLKQHVQMRRRKQEKKRRKQQQQQRTQTQTQHINTKTNTITAAAAETETRQKEEDEADEHDGLDDDDDEEEEEEDVEEEDDDEEEAERDTDEKHDNHDTKNNSNKYPHNSAATLDDDDHKYPALPDPLPFTTNSSRPSSSFATSSTQTDTDTQATLFDLSRYTITPIPCAYGCDDEYCSETCRLQAWQQYHCILCSRTSFTTAATHSPASTNSSSSSSSSTASSSSNVSTTRSTAIHPLFIYYQHADHTNEIFRVVLKMIATIITGAYRQPINSPSAATSTAAGSANGDFTSATTKAMDNNDPFFPYSLFTSSLWWEQVSVPESTSPASALRLRFSLHELCAHTLQLLLPLFPDYVHDRRYSWLFTTDTIGKMVSIFELNQLAVFAPSPLSTYLAYYHTLSPAQQSAFKAQLPAPIFADTRHIANLRIEGMGLFSIACCINHSCAPSLQLVKRDHIQEQDGFVDIDVRMSCMCVQPRGVQAGTEVTLSYIDEDIDDVDERAVLLAEYGFVCDCIRCITQRQQKRMALAATAVAEEESESGDDALQQFEDDDNEDAAAEDDADEEDDDDEA